MASQGAVAHGLVQVHGVEHGRVETGEQLLGDDEDLGVLVQLGEGLADLPLLLVLGVELLQQGAVVVVAGVHHFAVLGR